MATVALEDVIAALPKDEQEAIERRADELVAEAMTLAELRKALGETQKELAAKRGMKQAGVARLEKRADMLLSTLRSHVEAMGGTLDLVATFPDRGAVRVRLGDLTEA